MRVKDTIIIILFLVITNFIIVYSIIDMSGPEDMLKPSWFMAFVLIFPVLFIFNFSIRNNLGFKGYFTSKFNILTSKYRATIASELPKELMYQKMIEVLRNSPFKLEKTDDTKLEILSTKGIAWTSWGENIYIDFTEINGKTQMNFISTTVMGVVSWGKNEKNYNRLLSTYEESLTI